MHTHGEALVNDPGRFFLEVRDGSNYTIRDRARTFIVEIQHTLGIILSERNTVNAAG